MQVALRDGDQVSKRAIVVGDADGRAVRAVSRAAGQARLTSPATAIDLSDDATSGVGPVLGHADELVSEHAAEAHVASDQLQIGFADAGAEHPYHDLAVREYGWWAVGAQRDTVAVQDYGAHMMMVSEALSCACVWIMASTGSRWISLKSGSSSSSRSSDPPSLIRAPRC